MLADLHHLAAIMDTSFGRNFSTKDWDRGKANLGNFVKSLDLIKVALDISGKDLRHAQELAKQADLANGQVQVDDALNGPLF